MPRHERFGKRDLTYSAWHRSIEPEGENSLPYVDIDAVEYCPACREPLALIETAEDVGQDFKPTIVMQRLAARAGLPAYLVLYRKDVAGGIDRFRLIRVWPREAWRWRVLDPEEYARFLRSLRAGHVCGEGGGKHVGNRDSSRN
jgi:predicted Ser/Thr protein kinase